MKIAVVGCSHGELDKIYGQAQHIENERNIKIDLLICCGDFQATRNEADLRCMAVPPKYYNMGSFYKYYSGGKLAPMLTIFIGGNHEASNYLQELPYGGWVAPRIYYLGYAGVVNFGGVRIGGISGIYKPVDYMKGHFEKAPYSEDAKRSVYHVRNVEVFRMKQLSDSLDIMMSHDWPREVYNYGSIDELIRNKPFFENEVNENTLGSKPCEELLFHLKPKHWFSAHLHTKFCAVIPHIKEDGSVQSETNFMALDKCLPRRRWIDIIDVPNTADSLELMYDLEWLAILHLTDHLMSSKKTNQFMPGPSSCERWDFIPTKEEKEFIKEKFGHDLRIPDHFVRTAPLYEPNNRGRISPPRAVINPQTVTFCEKLGIRDPLTGLVDDYSNYDRYSSSPRAFSTPEKFNHNDSTYMSFNNSNTSDNASFFSNRSSMCNNINTSSPAADDTTPKRLKLSLPPPVNQSMDDSTESDILPFEIDRNGSIDTTSTPDVQKVFKRRNASLYASEDE